MNVNRSSAPVACWCLVVPIALLVGAGDAHAYLDPSSGSMILQGIVGGVFAALFLVRRQWAQLKGWFTGRRKAKTESAQASSDRDTN